jgi:hypothetical protein
MITEKRYRIYKSAEGLGRLPVYDDDNFHRGFSWSAVQAELDEIASDLKERYAMVERNTESVVCDNFRYDIEKMPIFTKQGFISELWDYAENGCTVVSATGGNGGSGIDFDNDAINHGLLYNLKNSQFDGICEAKDILDDLSLYDADIVDVNRGWVAQFTIGDPYESNPCIMQIFLPYHY